VDHLSNGTSGTLTGHPRDMSRTSRRDRTGHPPTKGVRVSRCPEWKDGQEQLITALCRFVFKISSVSRSHRRGYQASQPRAPVAIAQRAAVIEPRTQTLTSDSRKPAGRPSASHALPNSRLSLLLCDVNRCISAITARSSGCSTHRWSARRTLCARMLRDYPRKLEEARTPAHARARAMAGAAWPWSCGPWATSVDKGGGVRGVARNSGARRNAYLPALFRGLFSENRPNKQGVADFLRGPASQNLDRRPS
jgi:hypothetical protein